MIDAKFLIEENNRKRKLLTKDNEAFYDDLLIYIRLQMSLSEQQSEEVLMEMLDHLIEGQKEGKTAKDIFGDDPLSFANEIIEQLPKEKRRNVISFVGGIVVNIVSWALMIRGLLLLLFAQFTKVNAEINLFVASLITIAIGIFIVFNTWFIFNQIKSSLFKEKQEKRNIIKDTWKVGLVSVLSMTVVIVAAKFTPEIGPSFQLNWWLSLLLGVILWMIHFILKKKQKI